MVNEVFGWVLITLGLLTGTVLGLFFTREDWLGGYSALPRRLVRLGHIALLGLGLLNVLFAGSAPRAQLAEWELAVASWGFMIGGVTMPLVCGLTAWKRPFGALFFIPVASLLTGAITLTRGLAGL